MRRDRHACTPTHAHTQSPTFLLDRLSPLPLPRASPVGSRPRSPGCFALHNSNIGRTVVGRASGKNLLRLERLNQLCDGGGVAPP
mmetsp:Transcript_38148/g.113982  ORF Transcript_38148/g.113982 Transcript_38148/m.113982 type:complete len:85 (-) Transcript_38148:164-418(-)